MDVAEREQIGMTGISYVNELYARKSSSDCRRKSARFVNTGLVVTLRAPLLLMDLKMAAF